VPPGWAGGNRSGWQGQANPPGWTHGDRSGWQEGLTPPGWSYANGSDRQSRAGSRDLVTNNDTPGWQNQANISEWANPNGGVRPWQNNASPPVLIQPQGETISAQEVSLE